MKQLTRFAAGLVLAALATCPALGQARGPLNTADRPPIAAAGPAADLDALGRFLHCLRVIDLTDAQKTAIQNFIEGEKPTLQSLHDTLQADQKTLQTDTNAVPPDPCKIGNDVLKVKADGDAIAAEFDKIKAFIEGQLTAEQKARFDGCLQGIKPPTAAGAVATPAQ